MCCPQGLCPGPHVDPGAGLEDSAFGTAVGPYPAEGSSASSLCPEIAYRRALSISQHFSPGKVSFSGVNLYSGALRVHPHLYAGICTHLLSKAGCMCILGFVGHITSLLLLSFLFW